MVKKLSLVFLLVTVLLTSCKQSSFLKQKYTRYGHAKQQSASSERSSARPQKLTSHPVISRHEVVSTEAVIPSPLQKSEKVCAQSVLMPLRKNDNSPGIVCSAEVGGYTTTALKKVKSVPAKLDQKNLATGIPIISPVLRIVFLVLLIVLVVLLIVLFV